MAISEAMAAQLPVISTRHSGIPEHVQDGVTGLLVEEGDVEGMAAAMARLLEDPALAAAMGKAGRAYALVNLSRAGPGRSCGGSSISKRGSRSSLAHPPQDLRSGLVPRRFLLPGPRNLEGSAWGAGRRAPRRRRRTRPRQHELCAHRAQICRQRAARPPPGTGGGFPAAPLG